MRLGCGIDIGCCVLKQIEEHLASRKHLTGFRIIGARDDEQETQWNYCDFYISKSAQPFVSPLDMVC